MKKLAIAVMLLGAIGTAQAATGDAAAGQAKAAVCAACHGADGNSVVPTFPRLAGQGDPYIVKQLTDFKSGARSNAIMSPMAKPLSDQDVLNLAAYFSSQKAGVDTANAAQAALGEKLYRGGDKATGVAACMACHGPDGSGNPAAKFPKIGGQHAAYVEAQLKAFRDGSRSNDPNKMMRDIAGRMTDAEIASVAQYVSGLH